MKSPSHRFNGRFMKPSYARCCLHEELRKAFQEMNSSLNSTHQVHEDSEDSNTSSNPSFNDVLDTRLSRRHALRVSVGSVGAAMLGSFPLASCGGGTDALAAPVNPAIRL